MPYYTPLRYPGGKRRLAPVVMRLLEENGLADVEYVEPYAGGSAIALALLFEERASTVHINDLSRPVYAFWHTVLNETAELCRRVERVRVSMTEWRRQRAVYENRNAADLDLVDLGFAALFLNRTNRSGIIAGGVIGGKGQTGEWRLDVRFNKDELVQRIRRIGRYRSRIRLYNMDALDFTDHIAAHLNRSAFFFYDPPYIENGEDLYLNDYDLDDHRAISARILGLEQPWVVTYDDAAARIGLYRGCRRISYDLHYSAQTRHQGREVMFLSDRVKVPREWSARKPILLSRASNRHRVYGRMGNVKGEGTPEPPPSLAKLKKFVRAVSQVPKRELDAKLAAYERSRRPARARRKRTA